MRPAVLTILIWLAGTAWAFAAEKDGVLIVCNPKLAGSRDLAEYYAEKRGIPESQIYDLPCSANEAVSRTEYVETIEQPLRRYLFEKGWWVRAAKPSVELNSILETSKLKYLVLCHGVPLKIEAAPARPGEQPASPLSDCASVDTELATLPMERATTAGFAENPFFGKPELPENAALRILLVTRLDGPNALVARRLVDSALEGERIGVWGRAVVDMRGIHDGAYAQGDRWLSDLAQTLRTDGWNPTVDSEEGTLRDPAAFSDCAIYAGWYSESITGPLASDRFHFRPGAIAYHIHSFSASTLRSYDRNWVGPLVARGVAATMGCVYEPYLQFSPRLDFFFRQLFAGRNFAEAAYLSQPCLSWQTTFVGDPLYRPFARSFDESLQALQAANAPEIAWARLRQIHQLAAAGMKDQALQELKTWTDSTPNPLALQSLASLLDEQGRPAEASAVWAKLASSPVRPEIQTDAQIRQARSEWAAGHHAMALQLFEKFLASHATYPMARDIAAEALKDARQKGFDAAAFQKILSPAP